MINRFPIENGWYGDYLLTGEWCCLISTKFIDTMFSRIPLPVWNDSKPIDDKSRYENVLFTTIHTNRGEIYISGQGNTTGYCWLYTLSKDKWEKVDTTFGTRPVAFYKDKIYISLPVNKIGIYDLKTLKQLETIVMNVGVNGIRVIQDDGTIITGDSTYNGSLDPKINLAEYVPLPNGSYIGQSYVDGCIIVINGMRKVLEPGNCKFIRAYYSNGSYHVTTVKELEHITVFLDFTDSDISELPDEDGMTDNTQAQIDALNSRVSNLESKSNNQQSQINNLTHRVETLESKHSNGSKLVSIRSSRGKYLRDDWGDDLGHFDRDTAGSGEQYTLESVGDNPNPPNPSVDNALITDGKFFKRDGKIVRIKRFTSFKLLNLFESGNDITSILDDYVGYNSARVFCYTSKKDWGNESWNFPDNSAVVEFLSYMSGKGLDIELTLITDNDTSMLDRAKKLVEYLSKKSINNLTLESVNEPFIHDKIDPNELKNVLSGSPYLYSSGVYTDNKKFYGKYWNDHSSRDSEWWRKGGHNLMEAWNGGGPNFPDEPALKIPGIEDEPIKPSEVGYDARSFYEYSSSCGLMGAGACFHSESGKFSRNLTPEESNCKNAFLSGLNIYPLDAANGQYRRIDESETGRTYVMGNHAIRIHQFGNSFPESGWIPLDDIGVCWRRV